MRKSKEQHERERASAQQRSDYVLASMSRDRPKAWADWELDKSLLPKRPPVRKEVR